MNQYILNQLASANKSPDYTYARSYAVSAYISFRIQTAEANKWKRVSSYREFEILRSFLKEYAPLMTERTARLAHAASGVCNSFEFCLNYAETNFIK